MSKDKYKHAIELLKAGDGNVEAKYDGCNKWCPPISEIGQYTINVLNDPNRFRIKREPRRVFVNYYIGAEQIGVMHLSKEGAEAEANDEACEVAVEFVEVAK